jgi:hypothetical protein
VKAIVELFLCTDGEPRGRRKWGIMAGSPIYGAFLVADGLPTKREAAKEARRLQKQLAGAISLKGDVLPLLRRAGLTPLP